MSSLIAEISSKRSVMNTQTSQIGGNSYLLNQPIKDTVSISSDKEEKENKSLSTKAKIAIGTAFGVAATAAFLIYKAKISEVKKLAEHIDFKPAETLQEAIEFAKKTLGIKNVYGFEEADLDVLNFANKGLVNVSNAHKGQLRMPKCLCYDEKKLGDTMAGVYKEPGYRYDGYFCINKKYFSKIEEKLEEYEETIESYMDKIDLLTQLKNGKATFEEKVYLYEIAKFFLNRDRECNRAIIKVCLENKEYMKILKDAGVNVANLFKPVSKELYNKTIGEINDALSKAGIEVKPVVPSGKEGWHISPFSFIYHEMGHLQDMKPRVLAVDKFNYDETKYSEELKKWVNNKEYMETALEVSDYSTYGPGEFIAEAYAEMIAGNKLSDRVLDLYKKLGGPSIPGIV